VTHAPWRGGSGGAGVHWPPPDGHGACGRRTSRGARQRPARRRARRPLGRRRRRRWRWCGRRRRSGRLVGPTRRAFAAAAAPRSIGCRCCAAWCVAVGDALGVSVSPADGCVATLVWAHTWAPPGAVGGWRKGGGRRSNAEEGSGWAPPHQEFCFQGRTVLPVARKARLATKPLRLAPLSMNGLLLAVCRVRYWPTQPPPPMTPAGFTTGSVGEMRHGIADRVTQSSWVGAMSCTRFQAWREASLVLPWSLRSTVCVEGGGPRKQQSGLESPAAPPASVAKPFAVTQSQD